MDGTPAKYFDTFKGISLRLVREGETVFESTTKWPHQVSGDTLDKVKVECGDNGRLGSNTQGEQEGIRGAGNVSSRPRSNWKTCRNEIQAGRASSTDLLSHFYPG